MTQDPAKAAKARALVASLLFVETGVILALALWLIGLTITSDSFEVYPLLGVFLFAVLRKLPSMKIPVLPVGNGAVFPL